MRSIVLTAALASCVVASQDRVNFRGSGQMGASQINDALLKEMAYTDKELGPYEDDLRHMFVSLPKNRHGNLGHEAVRLALHRFFVHRHGWWLRGLYLSATGDNITTIEEKDRVPDLLQEAFERRSLERGADLHALAALAASVEDLVSKETLAHLRDSYKATGAAQHAVSRDVARDVIHTYFMSFLLEHNWTVESREDLLQKNRIFAARYPLYDAASKWVFGMFDKEVGSASTVELDKTVKIASRVGEEYHDLNDAECTDLSATLQKVESRKPGRVRLSVFYNMSLHSHWKFNERVETLRDLGALDESDSSAKYVIITNYAMARPNCVNASNIYEICCPNLCEGIVSHLEKDIGNSSASVQRIAGLVSKFRSDSVQGDREVSETLLKRLNEVAAHHNGIVPLHGRLFAQWLHHAYPSECPYPHESGTTNPGSWTGEEEQQATESEILAHVAADTCSIDVEGKIDCGEESADLPWTTAEELLLAGSNEEQLEEVGNRFLVIGGLALLAAVALGLVALHKGRSLDRKRSILMLVALVLAALASFVGLLDPTVMVIAALGSAVANLIKLRARRCSGLPVVAKTV